MSDKTLKPGVVTGEGYKTLVEAAKQGGYALPAVNVVGTNSMNACMEAAAKANSDIIIQLSNSGGAFFAGAGMAAIAATLAFDWLVGTLLIATWLVIAKVFRISSLAAIVAFGLMPLAVFWRTQDPAVSLVFVTLSAILIWRHRSNIQRLIRGTES